MTPDPGRWDRVTEAFGVLVELETADRQAGLDALAIADPTIHGEVASLLASSDAVGDRFDQPTFAGVLGATDQPSLSGRRIGPYLITREIGRGGMGAVWEAQRADDQYQKRVAIKMVVMGRDTESMLRRFRVERELLARLEHGNIATLLDGGVTEEGQPWFAMEYIEGEPITTWCATNRLSVRRRVELFRQVCAATQYAHEHLVVHRDLKPTNILVATDGTVKLLDFGVAKLTDPGDPDAGLTGTAAIALTAAYASPEQLRGESVSTASDIYSLGVVLYELLTGVRPFTGLPGNTAERTANPPSRAVTAETAAAMGTDGVRRVSQALQGDLDAVVLTALRPEIARRYRSVEQFSDDLQRALDGRQVSARPDTLGYRSTSLIRRNKVATAAAGVATIALVAATAISLREAALARAERDHAVLEANRTQQVTQFFQDVLSTPKPTEQGRDITVVEAIDAAIPKIDSSFAAAPDIRAAVENTLGSTLHDMGLYERARPLFEDALRLRIALDRGQPTRERADVLYDLAGVENETGASQRAESLYTQAIAMYGALRPVDSVGIYRGMNNLATAIHAQGRLVEAAALYGRIAAWLGTRGPSQREPRLVALANQATALAEVGRYQEAEPLLREAATEYSAIYGAENSRVATVLQPLAGALMFQKKFDEAAVVARRAREINAAALGPTNVSTVASMRMLLNILTDATRCAEAVPLADTIVALRGTVLPESDASIGTAMLYGGWCRAHLGHQAAGEKEVREGLALRRRNFPASHWAIAQGESILGDVLASGGAAQRAEAEQNLRSGYEGLRRELDSSHVRVRQAKERLHRFEVSHFPS